MTPTTFPMAPMSPLVRWLTWAVLALPVVMLAFGLWATGAVGGILLGTAAFIVAIYLWIWGWMRPREFVVDDAALTLAFPWRSRTIPRSELGAAEEIDARAFRERFGWAVRVGAGGLWGAFGLLWTREGPVDCWVSRADRFVLVERRAGRPVLITPDRAREFTETLR